MRDNRAFFPSSTPRPFGVTPTTMSLVTVTAELPDFVASAWLAAVTVTVAGDGRSAGAVYPPLLDIVPKAAFPPGTPFTLQLTVWSVVFATLALKLAEFPSTTDALFGVTVT
jgi:hypothetical protein